MAKERFIATRVEPAEYDQIQGAARRYYDGNTSMLFRQALRIGLAVIEKRARQRQNQEA